MKAHDAVAQLPFRDARTHGDHGPGNFVAENLRGGNKSMLDFLEVRAANSACRDANQHFPRSDDGNGNVSTTTFPLPRYTAARIVAGTGSASAEVSRMIPDWLIARPPNPVRWEISRSAMRSRERIQEIGKAPGRKSANRAPTSKDPANRAGLRKTCAITPSVRIWPRASQRLLKIVGHVEIDRVADGANGNRRHAAPRRLRQNRVAFHFHRFRLAPQLPLLLQLARPASSTSPTVRFAAPRNPQPLKATRDGSPRPPALPLRSPGARPRRLPGDTRFAASPPARSKCRCRACTREPSSLLPARAPVPCQSESRELARRRISLQTPASLRAAAESSCAAATGQIPPEPRMSPIFS